MNTVKKHYFVEVDVDADGGDYRIERWNDEAGRLTKYIEYNDTPEIMSVTEVLYDPATETEHADGKAALTETCLITGVVFQEKFYQYGVLDRIDGDAVISRDRRTGKDLYRVRYINGQKYEVTLSGFKPSPD